jgi:ACT domain-containing protein
MKAIITVIGVDKVGIIAKVTTLLAEEALNILDISQTIMDEYFTMLMLVDLSEAKTGIPELQEKLTGCGSSCGVEIRIQHEDFFRSMHRI